MKADSSTIPIWQPIIAKYHPTLIGECEKAIAWSNEMVTDWLVRGMFDKDPKAKQKIKSIIDELSDHALTKSHSRHISATKCSNLGVKVTPLEDDQKLQDIVLTVHHACIHTLQTTPAFKIIENQKGVAFIQLAQTVLVQGLSGGPGASEMIESPQVDPGTSPSVAKKKPTTSKSNKSSQG